MIANLPDAASATKRMQHIATNWDPNKNGQLLGEKESAHRTQIIVGMVGGDGGENQNRVLYQELL